MKKDFRQQIKKMLSELENIENDDDMTFYGMKHFELSGYIRALRDTGVIGVDEYFDIGDTMRIIKNKHCERLRQHDIKCTSGTCAGGGKGTA